MLMHSGVRWRISRISPDLCNKIESNNFILSIVMTAITLFDIAWSSVSNAIIRKKLCLASEIAGSIESRIFVYFAHFGSIWPFMRQQLSDLGYGDTYLQFLSLFMSFTNSMQWVQLMHFFSLEATKFVKV